ncbi:uncharacterized protein V1516DRAFT_670953 [Lipomyces oligophaga]|uniref:uncharacterized protein n=1 Tax=Lipomyces oligophaga TaxID=45792 RepID=UPI0034D00E7E
MGDKEDQCEEIRLFISALPSSFATDSSELIDRLRKFGEPVTELSVHFKPAAVNPFAFITIKMTRKNFLALRKMLNGVKFRGVTMRIEEARAASYESRLREGTFIDNAVEKEVESLKKKRKLEKNKMKLLFYIRRSRLLFGKRVTGEMRHVARDFRKQPLTIRSRIGGKIRVVKCQKQKLWGISKTSDVKEFAYQFIDSENLPEHGKLDIGCWINGYGSVIENCVKDRITVDNFAELKAKFDFGEFAHLAVDSKSGFEVEKANKFHISDVKMSPPNSDPERELEEQDLQRQKRERLKGLKVLQDMFGSDDLGSNTAVDSPVTRFDQDSDDDEAIYSIIQAAGPNPGPIIDFDLSFESESKAATSNYDRATYDSNESIFDGIEIPEGDLDSESKEGEYDFSEGLFEGIDITRMKKSSIPQFDGADDSDSDSDSESVSNGSSKSESKSISKSRSRSRSKSKSKSKSKTVVVERLRSIFQTDNETTFSLLGQDDSSDIDDTVIPPDDLRINSQAQDSIEVGINADMDAADQIRRKFIQDATSKRKAAFDNMPLFFAHPESAFLDAQSQFSKLPSKPKISKEQYIEEFYANRGEWRYKAKRRRRDVMRARKRREKPGGSGGRTEGQVVEDSKLMQADRDR